MNVRGSRRFRPGLPMTLFVLTLFPVLVSLGRWQLDRAEQKLEAFAQAEAAGTLIPLTVADYRVLPEAQRRFRVLNVEGRFDPGRVLLLDNQVHDGRVGYWVLQLFTAAGGQGEFLVNRGFVAAPVRRDHWPRIDTPAGRLEISGLLWPQLGLLPLLRADAAVEIAPGAINGWPRRVQRLDFDTFSRWLPGLEETELRLVEGSPGLLSTAAPSALPNDAPKHQGYAVQWFGLATVLIIGFVVFGLRNAREPSSDETGE